MTPRRKNTASKVLYASAGLGSAMHLAFARTPHFAGRILFLMLAGFAQSLGQVPMATILLRNADVKYRGRIVGMRMLAIYGNLPGLLLSGPLIAHFGYPITATLYCAIGLGFTLLIAVHWRIYLWRREAPANTR